jgi:hypothetical protein
MFDTEQPDKPELPLYYEDQLLSVNKLMNYYILRKDFLPDITNLCFKRGKDVVSKFYDLFVTD